MWNARLDEAQAEIKNAWRIPGTGEPGGLPSMGSHRDGHDWNNWAAAAEYIMRNAGLDEAQAGIKIARRNINNLR